MHQMRRRNGGLEHGAAGEAKVKQKRSRSEELRLGAGRGHVSDAIAGPRTYIHLSPRHEKSPSALLVHLLVPSSPLSFSVASVDGVPKRKVLNAVGGSVSPWIHQTTPERRHAERRDLSAVTAG